MWLAKLRMLCEVVAHSSVLFASRFHPTTSSQTSQACAALKYMVTCLSLNMPAMQPYISLGSCSKRRSAAIWMSQNLPQAHHSFQAHRQQARWPHVHLPQAHLPQVHLPQAHLPRAHLPQAHLPQAHPQEMQQPTSKIWCKVSMDICHLQARHAILVFHSTLTQKHSSRPSHALGTSQT